MPSAAALQKLVITGRTFRGGINPVRQERKIEIAVLICEVVHFHALDLLIDRASRRQ